MIVNIRRILISGLVVILSALLGVVLMCAVYALPVSTIIDNVKESASVFEKEGAGPKLSQYSYYTALDNFTDALMLLNASNAENATLLNRALLNYRQEVIMDGEELNPCESLVAMYCSEDAHNISTRTYPRYWHGYLIVLKPLLSVMNYQTIRIVNFIVQTIINVCVLVIMWKKRLKKIFVAYLLMICSLVPFVIAASLQYSACFYIFSMASMLVLLSKGKKIVNLESFYFFLCVGIATSFFDFLTYPIVTLGIPLILYMVLNMEYEWKKDVGAIISSSVAWGIGYVGMWAGKWLLASLLTQENVIAGAMNAVAVRSSSEGVSVILLLAYNIGAYVLNPIVMLAFGLFVIQLIKQLKLKSKKFTYRLVILAVIACYPIIWYLGASNHSYVHFWFTHKDLIITLFAGLCVFESVNETKKENYEN